MAVPSLRVDALLLLLPPPPPPPLLLLLLRHVHPQQPLPSPQLHVLLNVLHMLLVHEVGAWQPVRSDGRCRGSAAVAALPAVASHRLCASPLRVHTSHMLLLGTIESRTRTHTMPHTMPSRNHIRPAAT